jgi:hypothetical protein
MEELFHLVNCDKFVIFSLGPSIVILHAGRLAEKFSAYIVIQAVDFPTEMTEVRNDFRSDQSR